MKHLIVCLLSISCLLFACNNSKQTAATTSDDGTHFGKTITEDNARSLADMLAEMDSKNLSEMQTKVSGEVEEVCQVKGCWMTLKKPDGDNMRVKFKDYGFFVPKDISGKTVIIEGMASVEKTPVAELQHYAEDAGKSKEEIEKITEPLLEVTFLADGVIIK